MTWPEKPLYHTTSTGSTFYNGCLERSCEGERIQGFRNCIVHLSPEEEQQYVDNIKAGQALVFSSVDVDMHLVQSWIDRTTVAGPERTKTLPSSLLMQDSRMVGDLLLQHLHIAGMVNLTGLTADGIRMFGVTIDHEFRMEEANLKNELTFADNCRIQDLRLYGSKASHFELSRGSIVDGSLDARRLTVANTHLDAEVHGDASFVDASLSAPEQVCTISADFKSSADFSGCNFLGETHFGGQPNLPATKFRREARFDGAQFGSEAFGLLNITDCIFEGSASFRGVRCYGSVRSDDTKFERSADLSNLVIGKAPSTRDMDGLGDPRAEFALRRAQFGSSLSLQVTVDGYALIDGINYAGVADTFEILATHKIWLNRIRFDSFNVLGLDAAELNVNLAEMTGGGELRIKSSVFELTNFTCGRPVQASDGRGVYGMTTCKLVSLAGTNCDGLTLSGFDYTRAKFLGATKLDELIIGGEFTLSRTRPWRTRRSLLAEEISLRASTSSRQYWSEFEIFDLTYGTPQTTMRQLAAAYRALRKGREDQKDEPGSADFYYGEMEMRRLASARLSVERVILTLYWFISGYGLRAWRTLSVLALILVGSACLLRFFPLWACESGPPNFWRALLFTGQSGLSLAGSADQYSSTAQWIQLVLRIAVPALIALSVLAVRARVKR